MSNNCQKGTRKKDIYHSWSSNTRVNLEEKTGCAVLSGEKRLNRFCVPFQYQGVAVVFVDADVYKRIGCSTSPS